MTKAKYQSVLDLGEKLKVSNGDVSKENGVLKVKGTTKTQYEKDLLWNEIKAVGGDNPIDIEADIKVEDNSFYAYHEVKSGESLSKIDAKYYGNANEYNVIFKANTDQLKNPNIIYPKQILKIPHLQ